MNADDSGQYAAVEASGVLPVAPPRPWLIRELFNLAHAQLDASIEMLDESETDESDPAPSVPPQ